MITLIIIGLIFVMLAFILGIILGVATISPVVLVIVAFVTLDVIVFKTIFGKKKKEKK